MSSPLFSLNTLRYRRDPEHPTTVRVESFVCGGRSCLSIRQPSRWAAYSREEIQALVDGLQDWLDRTDPAQ